MVFLVMLVILVLPPILAGWLLYRFWQLSAGIAGKGIRPTGSRWAGTVLLAAAACLTLLLWVEFLYELNGPAHSSRSIWAKEAHLHSTLIQALLLGACFALVLLARFRRWRVAGYFGAGLLLAVGGVAGWWRYQHQPQPLEYMTIASSEPPSSEPVPGGHQAATADSIHQRKQAGTVFDRKQVERLPTFPGGAQALSTAIWARRRLPTQAENRMAGSVVVEFVVEADGRVALPHVREGLGATYDAEAVRIIRSLCCFTPGLRYGKPVAVVWTCDVPFY